MGNYFLNEPTLISFISKESIDDCEWLVHGKRVGGYVRSLLQGMSHHGVYKDQFLESEIEMMASAAQLHDIGKVKISTQILNHTGVLPINYFDVIKGHANAGQIILANFATKVPHLQSYLDIAIQMAASHHERWDGLGYPMQLKGTNIPMVGRIVAIADVYDALISARSYKDGWSHGDVYREIVQGCGIRYDPNLVDIFKHCADHFLELSGQ
ncbi:MAG: HD domain-containing phosphohydrolase [Pseudomonadota bacterium]